MITSQTARLLTESLSTVAQTQLFLLSIGKCLPESLQPFVVAAVQPLCLCCVEALHWYTETVHRQSLPSPARDTKEEEGCSKVCWSRFTSSPAPSTHSGFLDLKCHHWPPPFTSFPFYLWHQEPFSLTPAVKRATWSKHLYFVFIFASISKHKIFSHQWFGRDM